MRHRFDIIYIANKAEVPESVLADMMASLPVSVEHAEKVLTYLSVIYSENYSLDTVHVILQTNVNKSEVARFRERIREEESSSAQGLYGLSEGTTRHEVINRKTEEMAQQFFKTAKTQGIEAAIQQSMREESTGNANP